MNNLKEYIIEGLKINSKSKVNKQFKPKDKNDLRNTLRTLLVADHHANLNNIDVSGIEDMTGLFDGLDPYKIDISEWDVYNVTNMSNMFNGCNHLDCDISDWDVSNVEYMNFTFYGCYNFDCDLSKWDVSKVKRWNGIFGPYDGTHQFKEEYKPKFNLKNLNK